MAYAELMVILDRSGSMQSARADHEGGLKSFVDDQKKLAGKVLFTLSQFDDHNPCELVYDGVSIDLVDKLELIPRGGTPLLDAIGKAVAHLLTRLNGQTEKPDQVICMVITDGEENSSREYRRAQIKQMVEEREKDGWKFLFLGANIDAFTEAGSFGVGAGYSANFVNSGQSVKAMYSHTSGNVVRSRMMSAQGLDAQATYSALAYTSAQLSAMSDTTVDDQVVDVVKSSSSEEK